MSEDTLEKKTINGYFKNSRPEMVQYIPLNAKSILEIGCGEGGFIGQFKGTGRELWGVEINPEAGQKAVGVCDHVLIGDFNDLKEQLPKNISTVSFSMMYWNICTLRGTLFVFAKSCYLQKA